ncbi:Na+-dependent transporter [Pontibacter deserti]|uniref:Na+-dependent transporter n=2 Tax=Pontibacter TaxID=323449 RepID=UPI00164E5617|nr:Na+-dependent transporter [Pontibacter sp. KCTC 32443]
MNEIVILALKASILLIVLGYGLKATVDEAFYLFRKPMKLFRTLLAINIIMPLFVILLVSLIDLAPLIRVTLLALAISPLPPLFPAKPLKAGEREEYVIGLLVAASLLSILLIPLSLEVFEAIANKPVQVSEKRLLLTILVTIIAPLFLGIAIRHLAPGFAEKVASSVIKFAQVLLILAIVPLLFLLFPLIRHLVGSGIGFILLLFVFVGLIVGHLLGGTSQKDRNILAVATAARHPGIAMTLASANIQQQELVPAAIVLYLLIAALITTPYLLWQGREKPSPSLSKPPL